MTERQPLTTSRESTPPLPQARQSSLESVIDAAPTAAAVIQCAALPSSETTGGTDSGSGGGLWSARALHLNPAALRLFGATTAAELSAHLAAEFTRLEIQMVLFSSLRTGDVSRARGIEVASAEGEPLRLDFTVNRITDTASLPARLVVFMEDRGPLEASLRNQEAYRRQLTQLVGSRNDELSRLRSLAVDRARVIESLLLARDPGVVAHMRRVALLSDRIARALELEDLSRAHIVCAAALHDVGILYVPSEILGRTGPLSDPEYALVQQHPQHTCEILAAGGYPETILRVISEHHERFDGSGYPVGIVGEDICLGARILAVADVVDAMASPRPHRPAHALDSTLDALESRRDTFDADVVTACLSAFESGFCLPPDAAGFDELHLEVLGTITAGERMSGTWQ